MYPTVHFKLTEVDLFSEYRLVTIYYEASTLLELRSNHYSPRGGTQCREDLTPLNLDGE